MNGPQSTARAGFRQAERPPGRVVFFSLATLVLLVFWRTEPTKAAELTIAVEPADRVASVGIVRRQNDDGTPARKVNPKAKFDSPAYDGVAGGSTGRFTDLRPGVYDVIVFLKDGTRLEGYHWPKWGEFDDPGDPAFSSAPPDEVSALIREKIAGGRYYENKVTPLAMAGDAKRVRVLMQLLRDKKTSFDAQLEHTYQIPKDRASLPGLSPK